MNNEITTRTVKAIQLPAVAGQCEGCANASATQLLLIIVSSDASQDSSCATESLHGTAGCGVSLKVIPAPSHMAISPGHICTSSVVNAEVLPFPVDDRSEARESWTDEFVEPLSEREIEVLSLIAHGLRNETVGERLFISTHTVKAHTRSIYAKLDVHSRTEAVAKARKLGLLDLFERVG